MAALTLLNLENAANALAGTAGSGPVILGTLTLIGMEVPSVLEVGGEQALAISRLVGGGRVIQPMGPDPSSLTLAGLLTGPGAIQRAQQLAQIRDQGSPVPFGVAGLRFTVYVRSFSYRLQQQGAVLPYICVLEQMPTVATSPASTSSALSNLVGSDVAGAVTSFTSTVSEVSAVASGAIAEGQNILGQIQPVATLFGAGGLVAGLGDKLTAAAGLAQAETNLGAAPAAAASLISGLSDAASTATSLVGITSSNIAGITAAAPSGSIVADMGSLSALLANVGAQSAAVTAAQGLNRSIVNGQLAAGQTITPATFHS